RTVRVPLKSTLIYSNYKLILTGCFGKKLLAKNIYSLKVVYDGSPKVFTFRSSYKAKKFQGEGLLNVHYYCHMRGYKKYCVAKYKFIGVPYRYPTETELMWSNLGKEGWLQAIGLLKPDEAIELQEVVVHTAPEQ
uniref:Uncharacterized protein n=1 Tax=Amphimedon queenslandica TaxID=400682 RepID=A0A1X7UHY5_AMPQE